MKKILSITLLVFLVLSLAGCGGVPEEKLLSVQTQYEELAKLYSSFGDEVSSIKVLAAGAGADSENIAAIDASLSEMGREISAYGNEIAQNLPKMKEDDVDALLANISATNTAVKSQLTQLTSIRTQLEAAVSAAAQESQEQAEEYEYYDQQFQITNYTGVDIFRMYVSASDTESWEEDVLGDEVFFDEETINVTFGIYEESQYWDLRVEDEKGNAITWMGLDLFSISDIELYWDGQSATAAVS